MDDQRVSRAGGGEHLTSIKRQIQCIALTLGGVALIAACVVIVDNLSGKLESPALVGLFLSALWLGGGALAGAGVFHLFGNWKVGAAVGLAIQATLLAFIYEGIQRIGGG